MDYISYSFGHINSNKISSLITTKSWGSINPFTSYATIKRLSVGLELPEDQISSVIVFPEEVHGIMIHRCQQEDGGSIRLLVDGLATSTSGLMLCLYTADCIPILFACDTPLAYGALHAGQRGLLGGAIDNMISELAALDAPISAIKVGIGPCIHSCCYEIRDDLAQQATANRMEEFIIRSAQRMTLDLPGIARHRLAQAGILDVNVEAMPFCTACHTDQFFSGRNRSPDEERGASFASLIWSK